MTGSKDTSACGLQAFSPDTPPGWQILARQKLTREKLDTAIALHEQIDKAVIGTLIGVSEPGVIYSAQKDWHPEQPDAFEDIGIIPWILVHELLGNVPEGSMRDFVRSGGEQ